MLNTVLLFAALLHGAVAAAADIDRPAHAMRDGGGGALFARDDGGGARYWRVDKGAAEVDPDPHIDTPLGSVWKLFVYAWLVDRASAAPDYRCSGEDPEEAYCCKAGETIGRDLALVKSCGLYFVPARLGIDARAWKERWQALGAPDWLTDLDRLRPETRVPVASLLDALRRVPEQARKDAAHTLISVFTVGRGESTLPQYGALLRVKTWTMPDPTRAGARIGGAAGWTADGSAVWIGGNGASADVLRQTAASLAPLLQSWPAKDDDSCVRVEYFARYPIAEVRALPQHIPAPAGPLHGRFAVAFASGTQIEVQSEGELALDRSTQPAKIVGTLSMNEYVARVIQREGSPEPLQAARALAVVARSFLLQQAGRSDGCYLVADSSAAQRVAPRPATRASRAIADWSDTLVFADTAASYHADRPARGRLSWRDAVQAAQQGTGFDAILAAAFGPVALTSYASPLGTSCRPLAAAEAWLDRERQRWRRRLAREPGYEPPDVLPAVCALDAGRPRTEYERMRIYAMAPDTQEARVTLAHEYLHVAFAHHPSGRAEAYVERLARELVMGEQR